MMAIYETKVSELLHMSQPRFFIVSWLPKPRRAMTIPPFGIFVLKGFYEKDGWLEKHELIHWKQYEEHGLLSFYFQYLKQISSVGYFNAPFEKEAREKGGWEKSPFTDEY